MKLSTWRASLILIIAFTFAGITGAQTKALPNLYKVNANLYRGGQPTEAGIAELKQMGIKTIIDLRGDDDRANKEDAWAQAAGLKFINVPMNNWLEPKDRQMDKALAAIDDPANQPVFVHCKRGADRTGTVIAVYRISHEGWNAKRANDEAEKFGFGWWQFWMRDYIEDYFRDFETKGQTPSK
jgi:tyrosine-protein phosphatase SIW14